MKYEPSLFLAIDQGGHASRALIFDDQGRVVAQHHAEISTTEPRPGWVEHNPEEIVTRTREAIDGAVAQLGSDRQRLKAAGLATQRSSMVCWSADTGVALTPVISWADTRAADWLNTHEFDRNAVLHRTGLVPNPHFGASKMRWCLDNVPAVQEAAAAGNLVMGPLASFLLYRLLAERPLLADPSNGSRTLLMDVRRSEWDPFLLNIFGVSAAQLPQCSPNRFAFGSLVLDDLRVPLTVCTGDQAAALFCDGWPRDDTFYVNAGTGAFIQRLVGGLSAQQDSLLTSVVWTEANKTLFVREGTVNGAGRAITWLSALEGHVADFRDCERLYTEPPLFLNSVGGLGSPYWRADVSPRFSTEAPFPQKLAAVLESVAFLLAKNAERLQNKPVPHQLVLGGGLGNSTRFCQSLADLIGVDVWRSEQTEATASGLAFLLADGPNDWLRAEYEVFAPRDNVALNARYRAWSEWLDWVLASKQN